MGVEFLAKGLKAGPGEVKRKKSDKKENIFLGIGLKIGFLYHPYRKEINKEKKCPLLFIFTHPKGRGKGALKMTAEDKTKMYEKFQRMIFKRAWSFHYTTGIEIGELISQANLIFVECSMEWKPSLGAFGTFLTKCLNNRLRDFVNAHHTRNRGKINGEDGEMILSNLANGMPGPMASEIFLERVKEDLSAEAVSVVEDILTAPIQIFGLETRPKMMRGRLAHHLRRRRNWNHETIYTTLKEIRIWITH